MHCVDAQAGLAAARAASAAVVAVSPDHRLDKDLFAAADLIVKEWTDFDLHKYPVKANKE